MRALIAAALAAALAAGAGCYHTVYHFDAPPVGRSPTYDGRWRLSLIAGALEMSDPVSLEDGCPGGQVAEIREVTTPLNALVAILINAVVAELPLVHFRSVTMDCAPIAAPPRPGPEPMPAPAPPAPPPGPASHTR